MDPVRTTFGFTKFKSQVVPVSPNNSTDHTHSRMRFRGNVALVTTNQLSKYCRAVLKNNRDNTTFVQDPPYAL
jgi:hypothetical protein